MLTQSSLGLRTLAGSGNVDVFTKVDLFDHALIAGHDFSSCVAVDHAH